MFQKVIHWYFRPLRMLKRIPVQGDIPDSGTLLATTMRIVWPAVMESVLIGLVGIVDTMMVSSLGTVAISAVGLTTQPKFIGLCTFFGLNVAVSALIARRKGEGDQENANRILKQSLMLTALCTVVISIACVVFASPIITVCGSAADTHAYAVDYFRIIMGGLAFNSFSMVINAAQRGVGNTKIAMRTNVASNLVNIVFNYLLIGGNFGFPALGIRGAAIATVMGSAVGLVMSVLSICAPDGFLHLR
ncbi:MAG: MATE family efflux transporter, partial [Pygmaiobacter sp.]